MKFQKLRAQPDREVHPIKTGGEGGENERVCGSLLGNRFNREFKVWSLTTEITRLLDAFSRDESKWKTIAVGEK